MASIDKGINGDPAALLIDRAIAELRRGRAVRLVDSQRSLVVAAVETIRAPLLERLRAQTSEDPLVLILTRERAVALGIDTADASLILPVDSNWSLEALRAVAGTGASVPPILDSEPLAAADCADSASAALRLAKAARLVPALLALRFDRQSDDSLLSLPAQHMAANTTLARSALRVTSRARVPLAEAVECEIRLFRNEHGTGEHVAVIIGQPESEQAVPVRLHSACLTGDLLGSLRCDCGEQLRTAVDRIAALGGGVLLYLDQEGRGIGLPNKLRAYALQDAGLDTLDADQHLGFLSDEREYDVAAIMLRSLRFTKIRLLTNNPQKIEALKEHGIDVVGRLPLIAATNSHNERYIRAKRERAGHLAEESGT